MIIDVAATIQPIIKISEVVGDDFGDALAIAVDIINNSDTVGDKMRELTMAAMAAYSTAELLNMLRTLHMAREGEINS